MKFVLYKPYAELWFKNPVRRVLRKQTIPSKYELLFEYLLGSPDKLYISTRLNFSSGLRGVIEMLRDTLRILMWLLVHGVMPWRVGWVLTRQQFECMDAAFFIHFGNFTHEQPDIAADGRELAKFFSESRVLKVVHMTHFAYFPSVGSANLMVFKPDLLVAENDLARNSPFFKQFFSGVQSPFLCLPFVPGRRFERRKPLSARIHKLGVAGSITYKMHDPEFNQFFGLDELQPMRRRIYEQREQLESVIDCLIYDLNEARKLEADAAADSPEAVRKARDEAMARQRSYYNTDIVEFFNRYTMFAVPEEVCDLPGIGFIEGMACGTAYFGLDDPMYRELGMEPSVHYVAYDGSVDGLVEKVSYYQSHREELEAIAERGYRFARERMNPETVYSRFLEQLSNFQRAA